MILAAANTYLGLFAGLTIATAIPAAVVSMGVLRALGGARSSKQHRADGRLGRFLDRGGRDLHDPARLIILATGRTSVIPGCWRSRASAHPRRAVLGAAAAFDDRGRAAAFPGRQGRGGSAEGRREPGPA
jgi:hypothetical protein